MNKIPTLFKREFLDHRTVKVFPNLTDESFSWVLNGEGVATVKVDGECCAIFRGHLFRRYDAKHGKTPPPNAIPCCAEPDEITGHWPHWVPVENDDPQTKWLRVAKDAYIRKHKTILPGTYEAIGPHFQGNPYELKKDTLYMHGSDVIEVPRTFEGIKEYLTQHFIEGIVFWKDWAPCCKIKRSDFGLPWPVKNNMFCEE